MDTRFYHKRVLVLGGLGFIGSNIALRCHQEGAKVTVYDSLMDYGGGNLANVDGHPGIHVIINDVRDLSLVNRAIRDQDYIFNCAGHTSHAYSMRDPYLDIQINCIGTMNVLESVRRDNPDARIVYVGSATQCGPRLQPVLNEMHPEYPLDIYSAHKSTAEKYHLIYHKAYGIAATAVRLANVFGPRANIRSAESGVVNHFVGLAMQGRDLTVYGEGNQRRNVLYIDDCVDALMSIAVHPKTAGDVYLAASDTEHTVNSIAELVVDVFSGCSVRHVAWPKDRGRMDVGDVTISNAKLRKAIPWAQVYSLREGLVAMREFYDTHAQTNSGNHTRVALVH